MYCSLTPTTDRKKPVVGEKIKRGIKISREGKINCNCHEDLDKCSKVRRTAFGLVIFLVVTLKGGKM